MNCKLVYSFHDYHSFSDNQNLDLKNESIVLLSTNCPNGLPFYKYEMINGTDPVIVPEN